MHRWFGAALVIGILTVAIIVAGPSWLLTACDSPDPGITDCGVVGTFLVGFVGALVSACCAVVGILSSSR